MTSSGGLGVGRAEGAAREEAGPNDASSTPTLCSLASAAFGAGSRRHVECQVGFAESFVVPAAAKSVGLKLPFNGASLEAWTAQFTCGCFPQLGFAEDSDVSFVAEASWVAHVNSILDAAAANVSLAAMVGSAGCQSQLQVYLDSRKQIDALHYASFLMGVTSEGGTPAAASGPLLGTSAYFAQGEDAGSWPVGIGVAAVNKLYTLPLGVPITFVADAADYLIAPAVYARRFASALVLVNPTPTNASGPTQLNGTYYDATGIDPSAPVVSVHMTAHTGHILLTSPPPETFSDKSVVQ